MRKIVECVPNFSEGQRKEVIDEIVSEILSVADVFLLDVEMNADHNRSVVTFVGEPEAAVEAAFRATKKAAELIDLNKHKGEHPRIGATDVIPFVPVSSVTIEECVELAKTLGERIASQLDIPVYLYEYAATRPERVDLANIRKGEYEGLKEAIKKDPDRAPDFGKSELHPTAGATVVGARLPLIAYNINLNTTELNIAKKIAQAIRFRDGGLRYVKALGFEIKEKDCVQVSINMTDFTKTPLYRVFEMVKREAERYGVLIRESEIVGLVPVKALLDTARYYLQLDSFSFNQILENRLPQTKSLASFLGEVAQGTPTPGGGSVSALSGNLGTSLLIMVANLTIKKKGYEAVWDEMAETKKRLEIIANRFYNLIDIDASAFEVLLQAYKIAKEKPEREKKIEEALKKAIAVPMEVMEKAYEALVLASSVVKKGNRNSISDAGCGVNLLLTSAQGGYLNVLINLRSLKDQDEKKEIEKKADSLLALSTKKAEELSEEIFRFLKGL